MDPESAYTLTFGGFLLLGARAGDILGRRRMLITGLAIFTLGMGALVFGIVEAAEAGWAAPLTWGSIAVGLVVLAIFLWIETRTRQPLLAGLAFVPVTVPQFATSVSVPAVARRVGERRMLLAGLALCVLGVAWLGLAATQASCLKAVVRPMVLIGLGQGWVLAPPRVC